MGPSYEQIRHDIEDYDWWHHWRDRLICSLRGHDNFDPVPVIVSGPVDRAPDERKYDVPGFVLQCSFCHRCKLLPRDTNPGAAQDTIVERRLEDWQVWDDPIRRAEWLEMHDQLRADIASREFFGDGIDE